MDKIKSLEVERNELNLKKREVVQDLTLLFNEQDKLNKDKRSLEQDVKKQTDSIDRMKLNMVYQSPDYINNIIKKLEHEMKYQKNSKWELKRLQDEVQKLKKNREDLPILTRKELRLGQIKSELDDKAKEYLALQARIGAKREMKNRIIQRMAAIQSELRDLRIACGLPFGWRNFVKQHRSWASHSNNSIASSLSTTETNSSFVSGSPQNSQSPTLTRPTFLTGEDESVLDPEVVTIEGHNKSLDVQEEVVTPMATTSHSTGPTVTQTTRSMAQMVADWSTTVQAPSTSNQLPIEQPITSTMTTLTHSTTSSSNKASDCPHFHDGISETSTIRATMNLGEHIRRQQHNQRQNRLNTLLHKRSQTQNEVQRCEKLINYFQNGNNIRQRGRSRPNRRLFLAVDICCELQHFRVPIPSVAEQITDNVIPLLQAFHLSCEDRINKLNRRIRDYRLENEDYTPVNCNLHLPVFNRVNSLDAASTITDSAFSEQSLNLTHLQSFSDVVAGSNNNAVVSSTPSNAMNETFMRNILSQPMLMSTEVTNRLLTPDESLCDSKVKLIQSCSSSVYCSADDLERSGYVSPVEDVLAASGYTMCAGVEKELEDPHPQCILPSSMQGLYIDSQSPADLSLFEFDGVASTAECMQSTDLNALITSTKDEPRHRCQPPV